MKQLPVLEPGDKPRKATWSVRKVQTHTRTRIFVSFITNIFAHHQGGSNETGVIGLKLSEVFRGGGGSHYHRTAANFIKTCLPGGMMLWPSGILGYNSEVLP